jgi:ribosomal protein S18 acetylase RimI-like enzyme
MRTLPESLFLNPILTALTTTQFHLGLSHGEAIRFHPDVTPFAALKSKTSAALRDLHELLAFGERIWVPDLTGIDLSSTGLAITGELPCHQMLLPESVKLPEPHPGMVPLSCSDSAEILGLTEVAFPGFVRSRTCEMGDFFGIRDDASQKLIALSGERFSFPGPGDTSYAEISAVCTHPDHRGTGLASALVYQVARHQRQQGVVSYLHVAAANHNAVSLYRTLGFELVRTIPLTQLKRT